ncbi:aspartic peptidase domain-containing protein [Mycena amicta]|nr:aspartic peptidase domain-containing protein [Mycena amicta]
MLRFPATVLSLLLLHLDPCLVAAKPGRRPHYAMDADNNIINNYNDRYTVNLTVAGTPVNVMLDTGSTDMWVAPVGGLAGQVKDTGAFAAIFYGDGSNFINGSVDLGDVEIAGFSIPQQAFINVLNSVGEESDVANGIFGLVGLGFDGPSGSIPSSLTQSGLNGTDVGKAVLSSIYAQNPTKGQFFSFSLSRVGDVDDTADASLVISDFDPKYAAVANAPALPQYPVDGGRWSVVTDGISVNGQDIPWTSFSTDLPSGQTTVLFDTGTTNFLVPAALRDAIYSSVPGAVVSRNSAIPNLKFSEDQDTWVIPCHTAVNMTTKFAGQLFPIHPLDLTDMAFLVGPDGNNYTVCIGSVTNGGPILGPGLDALYGDSFLRNVYSVFSFGNDTTGPHVQLLADSDTDQAAADFTTVRNELLQNAPPELPPAAIIALFDGPNAVTSVSAIASATPTGAGSSIPTCIPNSSSDVLSGSKNAVNLANDSSSSDTIGKWGPIIVGLLVANLLLLLLVSFVSVMSYIRNGRQAGATKAAASARYVPVKLRDDSTFVAPRTSYEEHDQVRYSD